MAKHGYLERLADAQKRPILAIITEAVERHGSVAQAAIALEVSPTALHYHLNRAGKRAVKRSRLEDAS